MAKSGRPHRLLVYGLGLYQRLRLPSFVLGVVALAVWLNGPAVLWHPWGEELWQRYLDDTAFPWVIVAVFCLTVWLYVLVAPLTAFVQCRPRALRVNTPFWPIDIPYQSILSVRSVGFDKIFPAARAPGRDRGWLKRYVGQTAIAVDFRTLPISPGLARAFLSPYVYSPRDKVLCFLVKDWMALSTEIEHYRAQDLYQSDGRRQRGDTADYVLDRLQGQQRKR